MEDNTNYVVWHEDFEADDEAFFGGDPAADEQDQEEDNIYG